MGTIAYPHAWDSARCNKTDESRHGLIILPKGHTPQIRFACFIDRTEMVHRVDGGSRFNLLQAEWCSAVATPFQIRLSLVAGAAFHVE